MKIKRFLGKDMREALKKVKEELGGDAVIMSNKKVPEGIELVAAYDKEPVAAQPFTPQQAPATKVATQSANKANSTPTLSEIIGDSGPDSLRALLEKQSQSANSVEVPASSPEPARPAGRKQYQQEQTEAPRVAPVDNAAIDDIRKELKSLRNVLQYQVSGLMEQENRRAHPLHSYLTSRLEQMGINTELAEEVVSYAPESSNEREAWLFLLKLLANRISTTGNAILNQQGIVALVGPTGTGKTTTVAKLAARYAQKYGADQVALVTIDSYRIAAYEQLATYGKIIGCSVKKSAE